eukprot:CAMPEP_0172786180 /NCGR_PEP_ID=MMETSP1074-20121228/205815_1 /TAXON_ID=2916 /ORGANISM="Ceratium fusus, Strain PA161109" /LENGTH=851 /DNA_ID=CAMNT_0013623193 /DNA_START=52 /DNA_END=2607 /DNA_ORIENTATION=-
MIVMLPMPRLLAASARNSAMVSIGGALPQQPLHSSPLRAPSMQEGTHAGTNEAIATRWSTPPNPMAASRRLRTGSLSFLPQMPHDLNNLVPVVLQGTGDEAQSDQGQQLAHLRGLVSPDVTVPCNEGDAVQCPGSNSMCKGEQCCMSDEGFTFTCPSAPSGWNMCQKPKRADCLRGGKATSNPGKPNCQEDYDDWQNKWDFTKKMWCCLHEKLGCPETEAGSSSSAASATKTTTVEELVPKHNSNEEERGLTLVTNRDDRGPVKPLGLDCLTGPTDAETVWGWPLEKKQRCCKAVRLGCPPGSAATAAEADSSASAPECGRALLLDFEMWPAHKKQICCEQHGVGCGKAPKRTSTVLLTTSTIPTTTSSSSSSSSKTTTTISATSTTTTAATTTTTSSTTSSSATHTLTTAAPTSSSATLTTTTTTTSSTTTSTPAMNGRTSRLKSKAKSTTQSMASARWRPPLSQVTTKASSRIAETTDATIAAGPDPYNCQDWRLWEWSKEQQEWCCAHRGAGCVKEVDSPVPAAPMEEAITTDSLAESQTQAAARSTDASDVKGRAESAFASAIVVPSDGRSSNSGRQWHEQPTQRDRPLSLPQDQALPKQGRTKLRKKADSHEGDNYDCTAGHIEWQEWWNDAKRSWCCEHTQVACTTTTTTAVSQAFEAPRELWLQVGRPHNCTAGLFHWRMTWSREKKEWCCEHERLGCPWTTTSGSPQEFDCQDLQVPWTESKEDWCCLHKRIRCPAQQQQRPLQQPHSHFVEQQMLKRYEDQDDSQSTFQLLRTASPSVLVAFCACLAVLLLLTAAMAVTRAKVFHRGRREAPGGGGRRLLYLAVGNPPSPQVSLAFASPSSP